MKLERYGLKVTGIVQGVGFRPFIYTLAQALFLNGWVKNTGSGVLIEAEGTREALESFARRIRSEAPPLSDVRKIIVEHLDFVGYEGFEIRTSSGGNERNTFISPDMSVCGDCERELFSPGNRRNGFPFINCTNCGPRFSIIRDVPYDRPNTTMAAFEMCGPCRREYLDPYDRRYHAEPTSCTDCGPTVSLLDREGNRYNQGPIERAADLLKSGHILAIKGIGGYHLACDAANAEAVSTLRKRKHRDEKPFALMARDMDTALKYCKADEYEKALLQSMRKPVVLLAKREALGLPEEIAPGNPNLGIMLPYTPVHLLLFKNKNGELSGCPEILVMTSGNISSEPICYKDEEALRVLSGIADYFLVNDREIHMRTDDSVTRVFRGSEYIIRRSRGYVPAPVIIDPGVLPERKRKILACGGELKNTFCMSRGNEFYISHHIGDLENMETMQSFEDGIKHFGRLFDIEPEILAYDLHPGYLSTQYALESGIGRKIPVQHHHAHIASCMAENGLSGDVIGVAFDGTGLGEDGRIWGSEFFTGTYSRFARAGHFGYMRMPGGDAAAREPWRMALSLIHSAGLKLEDIRPKAGGGDSGILGDIDRYRLETVEKMLEAGFNSPYSSGMGRYFDAISALCGIRSINSYEGQAAMELEAAAADAGDAGGKALYPYDIIAGTGPSVVDTSRMVVSILGDLRKSVPIGVISLKFHETIASVVEDMCLKLREATLLDRVTLSGGVFQNQLLLSKCVEKLTANGFKVYIHSRVPANDGGISLGQAVIAMAKSAEVC